MSRQFRSDDTSKWIDRYGNQSDGAKVVSSNQTYDGANAGCSGTGGGVTLSLDSASSFANGDPVIIHQSRGSGAGNWELNKISSGGGTTSLTMTYPLQNTYSDGGGNEQAQILELKQYSSVVVNGGINWSAPAWDGNKGGLMAFVCFGATTISGNIIMSAKGQRGGTGNPGGGDVIGQQGEGYPGFGSRANGANGTGGGGGAISGDQAKAGGGGAGYGSGGSNGANGSLGAAGGQGGSIAGNAGLINAILGSGGGQGAIYAPNASGSTGGTGGGGLLIISKSITITGSIPNNGSNGGDAAGWQGGAGGGSGGFVLLKGQVLILGSNLITASGGAGGASYPGGNGGSAGGAGGVGRIHADYSKSISGSATPGLDSTVDKILADVTGGAFLHNFV